MALHSGSSRALAWAVVVCALAACTPAVTSLPDIDPTDSPAPQDSADPSDTDAADTDTVAAACPAFDPAAARARAVGWEPAASGDVSALAGASWHVARTTLQTHGLPSSGSVAVSPPAVLAPLLVTTLGAAGDTRSQLEALVGGSVDPTAAQLVTAVQAFLQPDAPWRAQWGVGMWMVDRYAPRASWRSAVAPLLDAGMPQQVDPFSAEGVLRAIDVWGQRTPCSGSAPFQFDWGTTTVLQSRFAFAVPWGSALVSVEGVPALTFTADDGAVIRLRPLGSALDETLHRVATDDLLAVRRPLVGPLEVVWLVPQGEGTVASLLDTLDGAALTGVLAQTEPVLAVLEVAPVNTDAPIDLKTVWSALGASQAFLVDGPDFSAFVDDPEYYLKDAQHVHAVRLDAEGVVGWASTSIAGGIPTGGGTPEEIRIDRSHLWGVRDRDTGVWWSVSWVDRPTVPVP